MTAHTRPCPFCAEEILGAAVRCKHCGADVTKAPLMSGQAGQTSDTPKPKPTMSTGKAVGTLALGLVICLFLAGLSKPVAVVVMLMLIAGAITQAQGLTSKAITGVSGAIMLLILFVASAPKKPAPHTVSSSEDRETLGAAPSAAAPPWSVLQERLKAFGDDYRAAPNEIKKSAIYNDARAYARAFFSERQDRLDDWQGWVTSIATGTGGESLSLMVQVGAKGMFGHAVVFKQSGIPKGSPVYQAVAEFKEKDCVQFSGVVDPEETSATEFGAMGKPSFSIQFAAIRRCGQ